MSEFEIILLALLALLVSIPFLVWIIFNRRQVWTRMLEGQLGKLMLDVDDLRSQNKCSTEIISELEEYIQTVHKIVNHRRRYSRFLSLNETNDLSAITSITRELVKIIR